VRHGVLAWRFWRPFLVDFGVMTFGVFLRIWKIGV